MILHAGARPLTHHTLPSALQKTRSKMHRRLLQAIVGLWRRVCEIETKARCRVVQWGLHRRWFVANRRVLVWAFRQVSCRASLCAILYTVIQR